MEYSSAEMTCVLKVNVECEACKVKVMHVLQKIHGVYNIIIDGEEGTVKVNGKVNPNILLSVLRKNGKHAEMKYVKLDGEVVERNYNYNCGEYGYNSYDNMQYCPYPPPLPCQQYQRYHHPYSYNCYQPPPPPPPPAASMSYKFPPPPPPGPFWDPPQSQPPPPPSMSGNRPSPSRSVCSPQNLPAEETSSRQNKQNKCSIM